MSVESIPLAHARAGGEFLDQHLVCCPVCAKPGAAHVGWAADGSPVLVRYVCPAACEVASGDILARLPAAVEVELTA